MKLRVPHGGPSEEEPGRGGSSPLLIPAPPPWTSDARTTRLLLLVVPRGAGVHGCTSGHHPGTLSLGLSPTSLHHPFS